MRRRPRWRILCRHRTDSLPIQVCLCGYRCYSALRAKIEWTLAFALSLSTSTSTALSQLDLSPSPSLFVRPNQCPFWRCPLGVSVLHSARSFFSPQSDKVHIFSAVVVLSGMCTCARLSQTHTPPADVLNAILRQCCLCSRLFILR